MRPPPELRSEASLSPQPGRFEFNTGDGWETADTGYLMGALRGSYLHPERQLGRLHAAEWVRVNGIVYRFVPEGRE